MKTLPLLALCLVYKIKTITCENSGYVPKNKTCVVQLRQLARQGWIPIMREEKLGIDSIIYTITLRRSEYLRRCPKI